MTIKRTDRYSAEAYAALSNEYAAYKKNANEYHDKLRDKVFHLEEQNERLTAALEQKLEGSALLDMKVRELTESLLSKERAAELKIANATMAAVEAERSQRACDEQRRAYKAVSSELTYPDITLFWCIIGASTLMTTMVCGGIYGAFGRDVAIAIAVAVGAFLAAAVLIVLMRSARMEAVDKKVEALMREISIAARSRE